MSIHVNLDLKHPGSHENDPAFVVHVSNRQSCNNCFSHSTSFKQ